MLAMTAPLAGPDWTMLADPAALLPALGGWVLAVMAAMVFVESGALFPFLPGDSLIFTAGLLHARLGLVLPVLIAVIVVAAALGDQAGYWLGRRFGRRMFTPGARVLTTDYLHRAEAFFARHGGKALVLARFVPVVRTFVPLAAGAAGYAWRRFLLWNIAGALLCGGGVTLTGSLLGGVPFIAGHVDLLAVLIVAASLLPAGAGLLRRAARHRRPDAAGQVCSAAPGRAAGDPKAGA